jgi:hypothetical protein
MACSRTVALKAVISTLREIISGLLLFGFLFGLGLAAAWSPWVSEGFVFITFSRIESLGFVLRSKEHGTM